jgi:hypothetical protein
MAVGVWCLLAGQPVLGQRVTTGTLTGSVIDGTSGEAVADATVALSPVGHFDPIISLDASRFPKALSDASGRFRLENIKPGEYTLSVSKRGYWGGSYGSRSPVESGVIFEIVPGTQSASFTVRIWRGAVITGKVEDDHGKALAKREVVSMRLGTIGGELRWIPGRRAQTADDGTFRLADLSPGDYLVAVPASRSGEPDVGYPTTFSDATSSIHITLTLRPGEERADVVIRPASGRASSASPGVSIARWHAVPRRLHRANGRRGCGDVVSKSAASAQDGFSDDGSPTGTIQARDRIFATAAAAARSTAKPRMAEMTVSGGAARDRLADRTHSRWPDTCIQSDQRSDKSLDDVQVVCDRLRISGTVVFHGHRKTWPHLASRSTSGRPTGGILAPIHRTDRSRRPLSNCRSAARTTSSEWSSNSRVGTSSPSPLVVVRLPVDPSNSPRT